jgi:Ser-tRNA(Ala) deacylase AlaX
MRGRVEAEMQTGFYPENDNGNIIWKNQEYKYEDNLHICTYNRIEYMYVL